MTPKNIHKIFIPSKNIHFSENPKNIEIQNFEPKKMGRAYICVKISEYPTPPPPGLFKCRTNHRLYSGDFVLQNAVPISLNCPW